MNQLLDLKGLLQEIIRTGGSQVIDSICLDHPADADNPDVIHRGIAPNPLADFSTIDIW